ncbi:hypothetical protein BU16DRAFT_530216 [Lophium mytilinum]|uniref:SWIM-type domain-containing protein n=1 Tax=Lophium mytilinum TaxID=390894 RepID=A0A6A6QH84_9PEZI|nr:hypothetical protein BU16DRAFT_530216 [Lophium mytilinum]
MPAPPPTPRALLKDLLASIPASSSAASTPLPIAAKPLLLTLHVLFPTEFLPALDLLDRGLVTRFRIREDDVASTMPHGHRNPRKTDGGTGPRAPGLELVTSRKAPGEGAAIIPLQDEDTEMLEAAAPPSHTVQQEEGIEGRAAQEHDCAWPIYHVRSAQQPRTSRFSSSVDTTTSYEVRLSAWNCSCPAFAFAAFPSGAGSGQGVEGGGWGNGHGGVEAGEEDDGWKFGGLSVGVATPPVCKHLLACVLVERCGLFKECVQEREVSIEEAVGWAAGWGD